jgi:hypothetical protein
MNLNKQLSIDLIREFFDLLEKERRWKILEYFERKLEKGEKITWQDLVNIGYYPNF